MPHRQVRPKPRPAFSRPHKACILGWLAEEQDLEQRRVWKLPNS